MTVAVSASTSARWETVTEWPSLGATTAIWMASSMAIWTATLKVIWWVRAMATSKGLRSVTLGYASVSAMDLRSVRWTDFAWARAMAKRKGFALGKSMDFVSVRSSDSKSALRSGFWRASAWD